MLNQMRLFEELLRPQTPKNCEKKIFFLIGKWFNHLDSQKHQRQKESLECSLYQFDICCDKFDRWAIRVEISKQAFGKRCVELRENDKICIVQKHLPNSSLNNYSLFFLLSQRMEKVQYIRFCLFNIRKPTLIQTLFWISLTRIVSYGFSNIARDSDKANICSSKLFVLECAKKKQLGNDF